MTLGNDKSAGAVTFSQQDKLPKLPIPDLEATCRRYLGALKPLQSPREHADTKHAVHDFLRHHGPELNGKLKKYAEGRSSYIEQFCMCDLGCDQQHMAGQRLMCTCVQGTIHI